MVESPDLEVFKKPMDVALGAGVSGDLGGGAGLRAALVDLRVFSNLTNSLSEVGRWLLLCSLAAALCSS